MDNESANRPLLSSLPNHPQQRKRRFRRCKTAPSTDIFSNLDKKNTSYLNSNSFFKGLHPNFRLVALFLALYLFIGSTCFYLVRNQITGKKTNGILDSLYFCVVTMTTVGYGDLVPDSVASKLLACMFVFSGMAIVSLFLSNAADYLVEKQEVLLIKALSQRNNSGEHQMGKEIEADRVKYKFLVATGALVMLIIVGTLILSMVEKLSIVDAFYCVCATITTLGYGDKSFSTTGGRVFAIFWILISTICVAQFFLYLAEMHAEHRQRVLVNWVLTRKLTFVDLEAADLDDDDVVSSAEFVIYKLKEMGKINQEDVALVMDEFENLDFDQSGAISKSDLILAQSSQE
ncbi:Two pore potassium channel a [Platanthera guangdongensis]|uniref:Two pore potassium channel a n=1 Tax=Platanthera guangdongensis TaxID=2320717 RepID=A0ABR2N055_9ASPA